MLFLFFVFLSFPSSVGALKNINHEVTRYNLVQDSSSYAYYGSLAIDSNGNKYLAGYFNGSVDFDPSAGVDIISSTTTGGYDVVMTKFDSSDNYVWTKVLVRGPGTYDDAYNIVIDSSDNIYTEGEFESTADFDPGAGTLNKTSAGSVDIFISKYDTDGNLIWVKTIGAAGADRSQGIALYDNHVYSVGKFRNTVDFDPGVGVVNKVSNGNYDHYIAKFDTDGNYVWAKTWGGTTYDSADTLTISNTGEIFVTGYYMLSQDFDPGPGIVTKTSNGSGEGYLSKFDTDGNFQWAQTWGGTGMEFAWSLALDATQTYVYVAGIFNNTVDFDPGAGVDSRTSNGGEEAYITKFDKNGNFQSVITYGGPGNDLPIDIDIDADNNLFVGGYFDETVDFDPGAGVDSRTVVGGQDPFLTKFDASGAYEWTKTIGSIRDDWTETIQQVQVIGNKLYVVGTYGDAMDLNFVDGEEMSGPISGSFYSRYLIDDIPASSFGMTATRQANGKYLISWNTVELRSTRLEYGTTISYGSLTSEIDTSPRVTTHSQLLEGLATCIWYHARFLSKDSKGNLEFPSDFSFYTDSPSCASPKNDNSQKKPHHLPQIPQLTNPDVSGFFTAIEDSDTGGQRVAVIIPAATFNHDAYLFAKSISYFDLDAKLNETKNSNKRNFVSAGGEKLGIKNPNGTVNYWQVGNNFQIFYKSYAPDIQTSGAAIISYSLQKNDSILSISYSEDDLFPTGFPGSRFDEKSLKIAYSDDGVVWKILPGSVVDTENNTVAVVGKVGGFYMIMGKN